MKSLIAAALLTVALLAGCSNGGYGTVGPANTASSNGNPGTAPPPNGTALFRLGSGQLPYPTDLYFAGKSDGTLNLPANPFTPNYAAINGLDGFSTTAAIRESFQGSLDPTSFSSPGAIIIVPVATSNTQGLATVGVNGGPLLPGVDYTAGIGQELGGDSILEIKPLHPLNPSTCLSNGAFIGVVACAGGNSSGYLVFLTNAIKDTAGDKASADTEYAAIKAALPTCAAITDPTLHQVCLLTGAHLQIAAALAPHLPAPLAAQLNPANIVLSFSFTMQSTVDSLQLISEGTAAGAAQPITVQHPPGFTTAALGLGLPGHADIYVGVTTVPYYLSKAAPLSGFWLAPNGGAVTRFNPLPAATQLIQIPVLVTVPNASSALGGTAPGSGWPVLIFQHGITRNREDMFAVADSFADAGFVVVAIDLPLHGITTPANPFYAEGFAPGSLYAGLGLPASGSIERTFDLATNGTVDASGTHFINLTSLLTSRDNLRQGVADLVTLAHALPGLNVPGGVNAAQIHYLGHSLGGIVGGTFLGVMPAGAISTATLANPGGEVAQLLRDSASFGPAINAGLAAAGVLQGTTLYEQFFRDAQTAVDSGDPINFIALATANTPTHLLQVVGSATPPSAAACIATPIPHGCPDQVVPNSATQRLITASGYGTNGLVKIAQPAAPGPQFNPGGFRAYVNFTDGDHGSIIDNVFPNVTQEMQVEAITFAGGPIVQLGFPPTPPGGTAILIVDPAVIQP